jgi:LuxR family maltose regulon positive regulatory protein
VQDFLLATSVLERMCIELCTAVAGETLLAAGASPSLLEQLERANLFIIPLDDERRWYRYHHLFAEVLRGRLRRDNPQRVAQLHRSASAWYAANGLIDEAIHHAFAGKDFIIAADLIEGYAETLFIRGSTDLLRKLIAGLPEDVRNTRPRLLAYQAFFLALAQRFDEAEHALTVAEDTSHYRHAGGAALNTLRAEADVVRTLILLGRSQFHETIQVGQRALQ